MVNKSLVIAIDGPDGVGKTTQVKLLADYFKSNGKTVHVTRHSGGTPIGEELRKVSLSMNPRPAETDLFISLAMGAALAEDIEVRKAKGEIIIIDRSPLAVIAYNGYGRQLENQHLAFSSAEALFKRTQIDLLLYLNAPSEIVEARQTKRGANDYFETQDMAFRKRVIAGYKAGLKFITEHPALGTKVVVIDAKDDIDTIHKLLVEAITQRLP